METVPSPLQPELWVHASNDTAVVAGFNLDAVKNSSCILVCQGYVPVSEEYCLMEHVPTGRKGNFRKVTFIKSKND